MSPQPDSIRVKTRISYTATIEFLRPTGRETPEDVAIRELNKLIDFGAICPDVECIILDKNQDENSAIFNDASPLDFNEAELN